MSTFLKIIVALLLTLAIVVLGLPWILLLPWYWALAIDLAIVVLAFCLIWSLTGGIGWDTVKEGTAVSYEYTGRFCLCAMEFLGHCFDDAGFVIEGAGPKNYGTGCWCLLRLGGWVFYFRLFVKPVKYLDKNDADGFGEGISVRLNQEQEEFALDRMAETQSPENVALDMKFVLKEQVVNPYLFLYVAPKDAKKQIIKRMDTMLRGWVRGGNADHAQNATGNGEQLWRELLDRGCKVSLAEIRSTWGFEIEEGSIAVKDVEYDPEYQRALKAKAQQQLTAEANLNQQLIDSQSFAAKTSGAELAILASLTGMDVGVLKMELEKGVRKAIADDPVHGLEKWIEAHPKYWDLIQKLQLGAKPILIGGADGSPLDPTATLIALWKSLSGGGGDSGDSPASASGGKMSAEELKRKWRERRGK